MAPATQPVAKAPHQPNVLEQAANDTWQTLKKPVVMILPKKSEPATAPASQPAPQAADATIIVRGKPGDGASSMRIPAPGE